MVPAEPKVAYDVRKVLKRLLDWRMNVLQHCHFDSVHALLRNPPVVKVYSYLPYTTQGIGNGLSFLR
jgi:hypothetical protein